MKKAKERLSQVASRVTARQSRIVPAFAAGKKDAENEAKKDDGNSLNGDGGGGGGGGGGPAGGPGARPGLKRAKTMTEIVGLQDDSELSNGDKNREPEVLFKKQTYKVFLSLFYGFGLLATALYDIYGVYYEWDEEGIPDKWHTALLYAHVWSFYVLCNGFIVATETNQIQAVKWGFVSLVVNILAFVLRLFYELNFMDFVPVIYFPPSE